MLSCKECGASAEIVKGKLQRSCEHSESLILADISAVAYGESHTETKPEIRPLSIFSSLVDSLVAIITKKK